MEDLQQLNQKIKSESAFIELLNLEMERVIVGQKQLIERLLIALLTGGHILLEGMPGLAKTLAIKTLSSAIGVQFSRLQFTPDLLPADIIGTMIYSQRKEEFTVKKGPVFSNLILCDEINRAPAKVQSALLEVMQEHQVTIGDHRYTLEEPFLVMATQNPIEQEGTYPLPEAQVDRFMMKTIVDYPDKKEELEIMRLNIAEQFPQVRPVVSRDDILRARSIVKEIYMDEKIEKYILDIVFATRQPDNYKLGNIKHYIQYGASPRATIYLALASKALAFVRRRGYVVPDDVRSISMDIMRHRIGLTYEAEAENITTEFIIKETLSKIEIP